MTGNGRLVGKTVVCSVALAVAATVGIQKVNYEWSFSGDPQAVAEEAQTATVGERQFHRGMSVRLLPGGGNVREHSRESRCCKCCGTTRNGETGVQSHSSSRVDVHEMQSKN